MTDEKETVLEPKRAPRKKRTTKKKVEPVQAPVTVDADPAPFATKSPVVKRAKRYSFDKWAARRGVKSHHKAGLKAFIKNANKLRTLEEWDECFKGY